MSMGDDSKYDYLWEVQQDDADYLEERLDEAIERGLWMDRTGKLYEMAELEDFHIMCILRMIAKLPEAYTPLVHNVRREKERRDKLRKNKFFSEELI